MFSNIKTKDKIKIRFGLSSESGAGFTMMELIVVLAIILLLALIVLASVIISVNKSMDAAVKTDLDTFTKIAPNYFSDNQDYSNFCSFADSLTIKSAIWKISQATETGQKWQCNVSVGSNLNNAWCVCSSLKNGKYFCIDSTGYEKETAISCDQRCGIVSNINGKCGD